MKKLPLAIAIIAIMATTGCKTTEANYRAAYMAAKEKSEEKSPVDGTIYAQMRKEAIDANLVVKGDTIPMNHEQVATVAGYSTPETVRRYSIVVNQFKQIFNAKSQVERLRTNGYPDALLVKTAEPLFYVVAAGADTPETAAELFKKVSSDKSVVIKSPFPWILVPATYPVK